jgi:hypothetical protein
MSGGNALGTICEVPDNGGGTATIPPTGLNCLDGYEGESPFQIVAGLPVATTIEIDVQLKDFSGIVAGPGGSLGGEQEVFDAVLEMTMNGTGSLAGFARSINLPLSAVTTDSAARTPGDAVQSFAAKLVSLDGQIFGDPDFDSLRVRAGSSFGLPSPGQTTLTRQGPPGSDFAIDSFFDVTYQIDFVGAPGSALEGFSGSTIAGSPVRIRAGEPAEEPFGHFKCYKAKDLKIPEKFQKIEGLPLDDQFGNDSVKVSKLFFVCAPADKDGSGISDPVTHLCCYKIKGTKLEPPETVQTDDQFGSVRSALKSPQLLCQPCAKTLLP